LQVGLKDFFLNLYNFSDVMLEFRKTFKVKTINLIMETLKGEREGLEKETIIILRDKIAAKLEQRKLAGLTEVAVLGIVGGHSVPEIFTLLKKEKYIDWTKVHIFMLDERKVPINHELSNFKMAKDLFLDVVPEKNVHPYNFELHSLGNYEEEMRKVKDYGSDLPYFDIIILTCGEDSHIASLFPKHDSIKKDSEMFINVNDAPLEPPERMSASRRLLGRSETAILIFFEARKVNAYKKFISDKYDIESCPAKLIETIKDSYILVDVELLTELKKEA